MVFQIPTAENFRSLGTIFRIARAFFSGGNEGIAREAALIEQEELSAQERRGGVKLSKFQANYIPGPIPPAGFIYDCAHCQLWDPPNRCKIVGLPGDNFGGEAIHPWHYCTRWVPKIGEPVLNWLVRYLDPSKAEDTTEVIL